MKVVYVDAALLQYSAPFLQAVHDRLTKQGIDFEVVVGQPSPDQAAKKDDVTLGWEKRVRNRYIRIGRFRVMWQPVLRYLWNCDLFVVSQENGRLVNYVAQLGSPFRSSRFSFWGHGRNMQAASSQSLAERWKRLWATRCDWWFAYTEPTRDLVASYGYPRDRITVFHNAVDTKQMRGWARTVTVQEQQRLRAELNISSQHVAVYVGGLYDHKRLDFLIEAGTILFSRMPDFVLLVVGSGVERAKMKAAAETHPWLRYLGPRFDREKVALMSLGRAFAMPGLMGLAILDAAAVGLPIVTTAYPYHSPEIAYLKHGENGVMVENWRDPDAYADALESVLSDDDAHRKLSQGALAMADFYTVERMVDAFCEGVTACLARPRRGRSS